MTDLPADFNPFTDTEIEDLILAFLAGEDAPTEEKAILDFIEWMSADHSRAVVTKTVTVGTLIASMVLDDVGYGVRRAEGCTPPYTVVSLRKEE